MYPLLFSQLQQRSLVKEKSNFPFFFWICFRSIILDPKMLLTTYRRNKWLSGFPPSSLPPEMWFYILRFLRHWSNFYLRRVCKLFQDYYENMPYDISDMITLKELIDAEEQRRTEVLQTALIDRHTLEKKVSDLTRTFTWRYLYAEEQANFRRDYTMKILFTGDHTSGKTELIEALTWKRLAHERVRFSYLRKEEVDYTSLMILYEHSVFVDLQLWDTAGLEEKEVDLFCTSSLAIFCFGLDDRKSFSELTQIVPKITSSYPNTQFMVVGTKSDLPRKVDVMPTKAIPRYLEVSSTTNSNIDELVTKIVMYIRHEIHLQSRLKKVNSQNNLTYNKSNKSNNI